MGLMKGFRLRWNRRVLLVRVVGVVLLVDPGLDRASDLIQAWNGGYQGGRLSLGHLGSNRRCSRRTVG